MRNRFLNIYSQIEWTYDLLSDNSNDFAFGLFFILKIVFFYAVYLRIVFSISDSQILFTKGQFPCLYYMPACLSRLPCVSFEILSVVHPRATAWPSPPQGGARISTKILHFVQNDGPGRKAPQRVASFPAPMTPMQHRPPVISSGVEKSHSSMVQAALGREISRLRVSIESKHIYPHSGTQPRSR